MAFRVRKPRKKKGKLIPNIRVGFDYFIQADGGPAPGAPDPDRSSSVVSPMNSLHPAPHAGPLIPTAVTGDTNTRGHDQAAAPWGNMRSWHEEGESGGNTV
jgi:hypothetical protein